MEPARYTELSPSVQQRGPAQTLAPVAGTAGRTNEFGQPTGPGLAGWKPPPVPHRSFLKGQFCRLEPLCEDAHGRPLFDAFAADARGTNSSSGPAPPPRQCTCL